MTHVLDDRTPIPPGLPVVKISPVLRMPGDVANVSLVEFPTHSGTHIDAPCHFVPGGRAIEDLPLDVLCGPAHSARLDVEPGAMITAAALEQAAPEAASGDILFIDTGFTRLYRTDEYLNNPYLGPGAADWIVDREIKVVGVDILTPDKPLGQRGPTFDFPIHNRLLSSGVLIVENVRMTAHVPSRFELIGFPMLLGGGADGAPVRLAARV
jgi:kynurenine formamidase